MSDPLPIRDEKGLAQRLRRDAESSRPEFSEALHERVCRAIRESRPGEVQPKRRRPLGRLALSWAAVAVAAACVAAAVIVWKARDVTPRPSLPGEGAIAGHSRPAKAVPPDSLANAAVDLSPLTGLTGQVSAGIPALVDAAMDARRWAYLDHDARLTLEILTDRFPFDLGSSLAASDAAKTP